MKKANPKIKSVLAEIEKKLNQEEHKRALGLNEEDSISLKHIQIEITKPQETLSGCIKNGHYIPNCLS